EANPGAIERGRFAEYRAAGVNRISLGAQSFDDRALEALGRIHDARETNQAVAELIAAGFENFNLDLMYGLPGQSVAAAIADLERALQLDPTHISHYQLTLEPGNVFYRRPHRVPDADAAYEMQLECQTRLAARGFAQYEVSAYAMPGFACRHNLNYWRFGDYLGIGAGAHGKWTEPATPRIVRTVRCRHPREYLAAARPADRVAAVTEVSRVDRPFEYLLNVLRLRESFTAASFEARTGLPLDVIARPLATACDRGLLCEPASSQWQVTELGRRFLNDLQALFLPDENSGALAPAGLA
ncbi:MAG TPA: radical SAM family heme chaperone HemW, partial [Steroidobacteraceae bacterium]|nr:radical SAM family heme chaperone HemW [Steroidobacteraceae bacterium]